MHACCSMQVLTWGYVAVEATILEKTLAITSSLAVSCLSGLPSATARWRNQCLLASYNGNCSRETRGCRQQLPCHDESSVCWPHAMLAQRLLVQCHAECTCGIDISKQLCLSTSPLHVCIAAGAGAEHSGWLLT